MAKLGCQDDGYLYVAASLGLLLAPLERRMMYVGSVEIRKEMLWRRKSEEKL
jgi:hypothetical protein